MTKGGGEIHRPNFIFRRITSKFPQIIFKKLLTSIYSYDIILLSVEGNEGAPQVNDGKDLI